MITVPDTTNQPKIAIGFSTRGNDFYFKLIPWIVQVTYNYPKVALIFAVNGHGADLAQEALFHKVMEDIPDYFFIVDTDVVPPEGAIEEAIKANKDVVVAPVWMYNDFSNEIHFKIHYNLNE